MHYQSDSHSYYNADSGTSESVARLVSSGAVVIFSKSTCYMCHAAKSLFCDMGVSPIIFELDKDPRGRDIELALSQMLGGGAGLSAVPTVFIGGKLVGSMDSVVAAHIAGTLVPLLREAGALWL